MASPTLTTTAIPAQLSAKKNTSNQNSNMFTTLLLLIFVSVIVLIVRSLLHVPSHSTLKYEESFDTAGHTTTCSLSERSLRIWICLCTSNYWNCEIIFQRTN